MSKKLILFPFGGNSREALTVIENINNIKKEWDVIGFIDDNASLKGKEYSGIKVLGGKEVLAQHSDSYILAVPGSPKSYLKRKEAIDSLNVEKERFVQIVHPSVSMSADSKIGYNVLIMANVVLTSSVNIGNHCVILPNTTISHDAVVNDYCCIGSNVSISGSVNLGVNCYIGSGSKVKDGIAVGDRSLVGLGSNVTRNIDKDKVVAGNPAKELEKK